MGEGKIEGREGGRWKVDKFFASLISIPYSQVLEVIRGTDKALQPRKFILIFRGDKAAVLSKVLNTSARCKNFCWHLRDLFSTTMILCKLLSGAGS